MGNMSIRKRMYSAVRKFEITPGFILLTAVIIFFCGFNVTGTVLAAVTLHELGHIAAIFFAGGEIEKIRVGIAGAAIEYSHSGTLASEIVIALAGPAVSFLAAEISGLSNNETLMMFSGLNLAYCAVNMVPVCITDGGKALIAVIRLAFGEETALFAIKVATYICLAALYAAGIYVFFTRHWNASVLLFAFMLTDVCCKSREFGVKFNGICHE